MSEGPKISKSVYEVSNSKPANKQQEVKDKKAEKPSLWNKILSDVARKDGQRDSTVVLLGDKGAGKRTLINTLNQKHVLGRNRTMPVDQMGSDFAALDFSFLYVKDLSDRENENQAVNADDNLPQINIWRVQESEKIDLLEAAISPANLQFMAIAIILDLEQPWELMNQLKKWLKAISALLFKMLPQLGPGIYEKMKNNLVSHWKGYQEPDLDEQGNLKNPVRRVDPQQ